MRRAALTLLPLLLLPACGGSDSEPAAAPSAEAPSASEGHGGTEGHGDSGETPASDLPGAVQAEFALLPTAQAGNEGVVGSVWVAQGADGTTVTERLTGLQPGREYVSHLHSGSCAENGGPHFQFDPAGGDTPPNEVHLTFTANDGGGAEVTVTNPQQVGDGVRSVVVHPADAMDAKLVCAPL